jgi:hypothetical protein
MKKLISALVLFTCLVTQSVAVFAQSPAEMLAADKERAANPPTLPTMPVNVGGPNSDGATPRVTGAIQDGVFFVEPKDGATVKTKFNVKFGVHGMIVKPAGIIENGSGHHHVIIRPVASGVEKKFSIPAKSVIPADETHIHYGKGQEEAELELKPGNYFLTLQFADGVHLSYGPDWARTIQIKVSK